MIRRVVAAFAVLALVGCKTTGGFQDDAFHSRRYPYSVGYADAKDRAILGTDWLVENYYSTSDGVPTKAKRDGGYRRDRVIELASGYTATLTLDVFDLLMVHKSSSAAIWLRTIPISSHEAQRSLRVVAEQYAEALSGTGFFALDLGHFEMGSREYASKVVEGHDAKLAGLPAYDATIDVSNVDQLRLDPTSRIARIRVLFVRTPFVDPRPVGRHDEKLPTMLMVGYVNNPRDFDGQHADFERFLGLIETGGVHGFVSDKPTAASVPSAEPSSLPVAPVAPTSSAPPSPPAAL